MKRIKEYWFILFYCVVLCVSLFLSPLSGEDIVSLPWKSLSYIFMLLLVEEGIRREKLLLPLLRVFNSIRETPFLFFTLLLSTFVLALFLFPFMVILIMLPFTIRLLKESNKAQYTIPMAALMTLAATTAGTISPFNAAGLVILFNSSEGFFSLLPSILPQFFISTILFILEALFLLRKARRDEIYLHIEDEDYWDKDRKGIRILYLAFFLVLIFGVNFNTIDLLLVTLVAFLILDRSVYKTIAYSVFVTFVLIALSAAALKNISIATLPLSIVLTRFGGLIENGATKNSVVLTLPSAVLSFSFAVLYGKRELKGQTKAYLLTYALLAIPHFLVYLLFALLS